MMTTQELRAVAALNLPAYQHFINGGDVEWAATLNDSHIPTEFPSFALGSGYYFIKKRILGFKLTDDNIISKPEWINTEAIFDWAEINKKQGQIVELKVKPIVFE